MQLATPATNLRNFNAANLRPSVGEVARCCDAMRRVALALLCSAAAASGGPPTTAIVMMDTRDPLEVATLANGGRFNHNQHANVTTFFLTYYLNLRCARTRRNIVGLRPQRQPPATNRHRHGHGYSHGHGQFEVDPPRAMHTRACAGTPVRTATRYCTTDWHERAASILCGARATPATASSLRSRRYWRMDEVATLAAGRRGHIAKPRTGALRHDGTPLARAAKSLGVVVPGPIRTQC